MLFFIFLAIIGNFWLGSYINLLLASIIIFAVAWIGQFWGHKVEEKKPSFIKDLARFSALSHKAKSKNIVILEDFTFDNPKTKTFNNVLIQLGLEKEKIMLVLVEKDNNIMLSSRNVQKANIMTFNELNVYNILDASKLIITESVLKNIKK